MGCGCVVETAEIGEDGVAKAWRLAGSLKKLLEQVNAAYPDRSRVSDGSIGDAAHAASVSDHNPDEHRVVNAVDLTHDPKNGLDGHVLAAALRESRDARIKYVIFAGRMFSSYAAHGFPAWTWRPYTGKNKHEKHVHISVHEAAPWSIAR